MLTPSLWSGFVAYFRGPFSLSFPYCIFCYLLLLAFGLKPTFLGSLHVEENTETPFVSENYVCHKYIISEI